MQPIVGTPYLRIEIESEWNAGAPVKLRMSVQTAVQYGAKANLGDVRVNAVDCSGNVSAPEKDYEVTLKPSASNPDDPSISAKVDAMGSNRARMVQGQATFKDVHLKSDSQGIFHLVVYCKSRAVVCLYRHPKMALLSFDERYHHTHLCHSFYWNRMHENTIMLFQCE